MTTTGTAHRDDPSANGSRNDADRPNSAHKSEAIVHSLRDDLNISLNNLRYNLNVKRKPSFSSHSPIWFLGRQYLKKESVARKFYAIDEAAHAGSVVDFMADFHSRVWLTYRSGFSPIDGTSLTTDCGWGCTLRCGQMLMAETLCRHHLPREWRHGLEDREGEASLFARIVADFADTPEAPFSIHRLAGIGNQICGKPPGSWFGPASTAVLLQALTQRCANGSLADPIAVYLVRDGVLLIEELEMLGCGMEVPVGRGSAASMYGNPHPLAKKQSYDSQLNRSSLLEVPDPTMESCASDSNIHLSSSHYHHPAAVDESRRWVKSVLVLVSLRLGLDRLNDLYVQHLKTVLMMKFSVGIIGGRCNRAMYYCGWHADHLICMDPHYNQKALDKSSPQLATCRCKWPKKVLFTKMDPNCTVGFYIRNRSELQEFLAEASEISSYGCMSAEYPLFTILSSYEDKRRLYRMQTRSYSNLSMSNSSVSLANRSVAFEILNH